ncbi:MAG: sensor domain-containing protein [Komagataeibacter hansenii]|mgnify:CR=1 FL=1|uniref:sensor domain-containing protein n=1 Tax=Novacetimonas hansenii TaxID=436 RepID=UPI001A4F7211|nr:sensor domain-containing protein [Novacetimonas hansenii]MBL7235702.1 sensor domain-containing protein [Novacetimonas hansenii]
MQRVIFPYIGHPHQEFHSLPIAMEMAARHPDIEVHLASLTKTREAHLQYLASFYPEARVQYDLLKLPPFIGRMIDRRGPQPTDKILALFLNKEYFRRFQAIVVPERTSLYLRRMGVQEPKLVWTRHGAGDRAVGFAKDVRHFDYILMAGDKVEQRLMAQGSLRPGHYKNGIYAKFDLVQRMNIHRARLFQNDRPTILYNPHFSRHLSSFPKFGIQILDYFARQQKYNLVFAPHYRLFDSHRTQAQRLFHPYRNCGHMLFDPGSEKSIDMTYTMGSDLYMGDVSSQVAEFLTTPRPCLFVDAHATQWRDNPNYTSWSLGNVIHSVTDLDHEIDRAFTMQTQFLDRQKSYIHDTFGHAVPGPSAATAANSIIDFLRAND